MGNEEIRQMSRNRFRKITKKKAEDITYTALLSKKDNGSKGRSLKYGDSLQIADYKTDLLNNKQSKSPSFKQGGGQPLCTRL